MAGPKWSEMKKVTDKDLRKKKKDRESIAALDKEKKDQESFLNKLIISIVVFILLVTAIIGYFVLNNQKKSEALKKELSQLKIGAISGTVQFKEKIGVWESLEKPYIQKEESLQTKSNGKVEIFFDKKRIGKLLENSIFIIKDIIPHADNNGVDIDAFLEKGSMTFKTSPNSGMLKLSTKFATLKINPGDGGLFKIQIIKKGSKSLIRVAVSTGKVRVNYNGEPATNVKSRNAIIIYENGKTKGPSPIIPGNEGWF
jgi:hypothetical protein